MIEGHRLFALITGVLTGMLACHMRGDLCTPIPLYYYLISDVKVNETYETSPWAASTMIAFVVTIASCQVVIETKRSLMNFEDKKADKLAAMASLQIWNAALKLDCESRVEPSRVPGVQSARQDEGKTCQPKPEPKQSAAVTTLPPPVRVAWTEDQTQMKSLSGKRCFCFSVLLFKTN
jgi:hypothetical protein